MTRFTRQELADEVARLQREHEEYRKTVLEVALEARDSEGWCSDGFKEAMETLGLADQLPSTERIVVLKVLVDAEDSGYDVDSMGDYEWAQAAISKVRYASPGDLASFAVEDAPKDK